MADDEGASRTMTEGGDLPSAEAGAERASGRRSCSKKARRFGTARVVWLASRGRPSQRALERYQVLCEFDEDVNV
jgi:hypothetical protein